jgi:uncharacterized membrane protein
MNDHTNPHLLVAHSCVGLLAGLTGVALADKLLTVGLGIVSSLTIVVVTELLRPWIQRRTRRFAGDDAPPPPPPPPHA